MVNISWIKQKKHCLLKKNNKSITATLTVSALWKPLNKNEVQNEKAHVKKYLYCRIPVLKNFPSAVKTQTNKKYTKYLKTYFTKVDMLIKSNPKKSYSLVKCKLNHSKLPAHTFQNVCH